MPSHLSAAEQKQVQTVIDRARGDSTVPHSAQDSIPFQRMFPDGICRVTDNYYTKTIQFQDINYQLAQQEDQTAIFEEWCSFLNFFDSSIRFELSFMNMLNQAAGDRQILADQLNISPHQLSYVTHSGEGEGLLFYGNVILPFVDRFPTDLELYRIMTTKLTEVKEAKEA